jgi:DNA-binding IclR family transcriptional regulator
MTTGKAHRYLKSYVETGLVQQLGASGAYDLGPLAVRLGLAALRRHDTATAAAARIGDLRDAIDETVLLAVVADDGPTVARIALSGHPVSLAVRVGTTFPLLTTATGLVALAFGERERFANIVAEQHAAMRGLPGVPTDLAELEERLATIRDDGCASVVSTFLVGVTAVAVPLFEPDRSLAAVVTVIGRTGSVAIERGSPILRALRAFCTASTDSPNGQR